MKRTAEEIRAKIEEMALANFDILRFGVLPHGGPDEKATAATLKALDWLLGWIDGKESEDS